MLYHRAYGCVRLPSRRTRSRGKCLRASNCKPTERTFIAAGVDDTPIGELFGDEFGNALDRRRRVERRSKELGYAAKEIEPALALAPARDRRSFCGAQPLAFGGRTSLLAHVDEEATSVERLTTWPAHSRSQLVNPHHVAVTREQAVFDVDREAGLDRMIDLRHHPLALVGVQRLDEHLRLRLPRPGRIAENRLHLRTDVAR